MMSPGKIISGIVALAIYLSIIFSILFFYNIHKTKAKNYVEKNSDRVTVTLVNSDKTVFNKSSKTSNHKKVTPPIVPPIHKTISKQPIKNVAISKVKKTVVKKSIPKKVVPKKHVVKKHVPKKVMPKKHVVKKHVSKKVVPKKHVVKKHVPKKVVPKKHVVKKHVPKKVVPKKHVVKKHVPKKVVPKKHVVKKHIPIIKSEPIIYERPKKVVHKAPKIHVPKKSASDLFSSVKTKAPTIRVPKRPQHRVQQSHVKHNSSMTDRIRATQQSGRTSNRNREQGVKNAYIAKVKQRMRNWDAVGIRGQLVTINLTIYQSGKFTFNARGVQGSMRNSLTQYLNRLNQMGGLGRHSKSTPYNIKVNFRVN